MISNFCTLLEDNRKYPLRGYILGSGAPGIPGIDVNGFFFKGGVKPHPLECRKKFSGGKVGGPGGK